MKSQKVLDNNQVNWFEGKGTRLNYQMIFNEGTETQEKAEDKKELEPEKEQINLSEALAERDKKWKIKVQNTKEEAWKEGFEEGKKQGFEEAEAQIDNQNVLNFAWSCVFPEISCTF